MAGSFRFGDFRLDTSAYALSRGEKRITLEKLPMELLILLVGSAGTLVDRQAIETALWSTEVYVERESGTNTAVRKVRRALEDDAEKPRFIETVVGKGYRFIGAVTRDAGPSPGAAYRVTRGRQAFMLGGGDNVLGRDPNAQVQINHPSVSRRHAQISISNDRAMLVDLESRNGTFLSGKRIESPAEIGSGAVIGLGPITLTFRILAGPVSTTPVRR